MLGAVVTAVGTVLSWPTHASTRRTGFDVASSVGELAATLDIGRLRFVALAWYLIPMSVGAVLLATALDRRRVWAGLALVAGGSSALSILTIAAAVRVDLGLVWTGPMTTAAGSVIVAVAAGWAAAGAPPRPAPPVVDVPAQQSTTTKE